MTIFRMLLAFFFRPKCLTLRGLVIALTTITWQQKFIVGGGSSYPWSRFMAGCPILILMASLNFLFNQMSSLPSTLTLSLVILWCSCAQCSPTAVSGFLRLRCSFILVARVLPIWHMYSVCEGAFYDELLLSCDRRQGDHMTSEEECAKYSKASHQWKNQDSER